jgi:TRAP-type C4-dicarboxylate transport system permease small subunit
MTRIADALFYLPKIAAALCLAVMILLVFGNVVLRHAASGGFAMAEELRGEHAGG